MRRLLIVLALVLGLAWPIPVQAQQFIRDFIVTDLDAPWVDVRAYGNLTLAVAAIGAADATLLIPEPVTCVNLTIPATTRLKFSGDGMITTTGTLAIQSRNIDAENVQIFTVAGAGTIDFADGTLVKSSWFATLFVALTEVANDSVRLRITEPDTLIANIAVGADVVLEWLSADCEITVDPTFDMTNIGDIVAGDYDLFLGGGDFDFVAGSKLRSSWFLRFGDAVTYIGVVEVELELTESEALIANVTVNANTTLVIPRGVMITVPFGDTLTINGSIIAEPYQVFTVAGTIVVAGAYPQYAIWDGVGGTLIGETNEEYSADGTVGGNSDTAVPTEQAVRTYVEASLRGFIARPKYTYNDDDEVDIGSGAAEVYGAYLVNWNDFTMTAITPAIDDTFYLYIDYSDLTANGTITVSEFDWSTTAPTWDNNNQGWYNGQDRCIFMVRTNGTNNITEFFHSGDRIVYADRESERSGDLDDVWENTPLTVPHLDNVDADVTATSAAVATGTAKELSWRTDGQTGATGHHLTSSGGNHADIVVGNARVTAYLGVIEIMNSVSDTGTVLLYTNAWYLPTGM